MNRRVLAFLAGIGTIGAAAGGLVASSGPSRPAPAIRPALVVPPAPVTRPATPTTSVTVSGTRTISAAAPTVGETLSTSNGTWTNSPTSFTYQWRQCDAAGASCSSIGGATAATYLIVSGDATHTIRVVVTATNSAGSGSQTSGQTGVVTAPTGTVTFNQGFETGPFTKPGTPGSLYQGIQAGNWSGQSSGAKHFFGDGYIDNGTSTPLTTQGSIFNLAGFGNVPPGDGNNSWRTVTPVPPTGTCPGCPAGQGYNLESTAANGPSTAFPGDIGQTKYYGLMFYLPPVDVINSSQIFGSIFYQIHWTNADPPGVGMALHTTGGSGVNGTANSVVLALETGACNNSAGTDKYPNGTAASPGCQYRSNADAPPCKIASDPNLGTVHCLPGAYIIPPGQLQYGIWEEVILGVDWESDTSGSFNTWYKTKAESTWHTGDTVSGLPTIQWDESKGCATPPTTAQACGYPVNEHLDVYLGLESSPFQMSFDDQLIGTSLSAVQNALPTGGTVTPVAPINTAPPGVSGTPTQGQTLTASTGTWSGTPAPTFTYQWRDCNSSGASCTDIGGATSTTYLLAGPDVTHTIRVVVTGTNTAGSAPATSAATGVVAGFVGSGPGTGVSLAVCTGAGGSCGSATASGPNPAVGAPAGALPAGCSLYTVTGTSAVKCPLGRSDNGQADFMFIQAPTLMDVHNTGAKVPVVFAFHDGCTSNGGTPGANCFTQNANGSVAQSAAGDFANYSPAGKYMVVDLFAQCVHGLGASFCTPTIGLPASACQTSPCDQGAEITAALVKLRASYAIDDNRIFASGGSKGAGMTMEVLCSSTVEPQFAGVDVVSGSLQASGASRTSAPTRSGSCPALFTPGTRTPVGSPHSMMVMWTTGIQDTGQGGCTAQGETFATSPPFTVAPNGSCYNGGGPNGAGTWTWSPQEETGTIIAGPVFGCSSTPTSWTPTGSPGHNVEFVQTYGSCSGTLATGNQAATQAITLISPCHASACVGVGGLDIARADWAFWTTGTTTSQ